MSPGESSSGLRHAQREVIAFLDKIDPSILEGHVDDDFRIALAVLRNQMARRCPATQVGAVMRKVPRGQLPSADSSTSVVSRSSRMVLQRSKYTEPASVRLNVRLLRLRRRTPSRCSTCITCLLTIAVDESSRSAAATKLPDSTGTLNTLMLVSVSTPRVYARCSRYSHLLLRGHVFTVPRVCRFLAENLQNAPTLGHGAAKSQTHQVPTVAALEQQIAEHSRAVRFEHAHGPSASA